MVGIYIIPQRSGGFEVTCINGGHFPLDWFEFHAPAMRYAQRIGKERKLPVFNQIQAAE